MKESPETIVSDLSLPLDIDTERWARLAKGAIRLGCLLFVVLVAIAAVAPVREIAIATGQLTTPAPPLEIEHYDGGIVDDILVTEGQRISAGAPLVSLSKEQIISELGQIRSRRAHQTLQHARLVALVKGSQPKFGNQFNAFEGLINEQSALFSAQRAAVIAEKQATQAEIRDLALERKAANREIESLRAQLSHAQKEVNLQSGLLNRGLTTRSRVLALQRESERLRADLAASQRSALSTSRAISDANRRLAIRSSELNRNWSQEIAELSASILELEEAERQLLAKLKRIVIRSPVSGIVHEIAIGGSGDVLAPGDHVVTVVPASAELVAEVRLNPKDVGFVGVGSTAEITITTFDQEIFGTLTAKTVSVSPTTFQIRDDEPHYLVRLAVDRRTLEGEQMKGQLLPGMVVRAEFRTGEKSILRYMLKPIVRAWDVAFSER